MPSLSKLREYFKAREVRDAAVLKQEDRVAFVKSFFFPSKADFYYETTRYPAPEGEHTYNSFKGTNAKFEDYRDNGTPAIQRLGIVMAGPVTAALRTAKHGAKALGRAASVAVLGTLGVIASPTLLVTKIRDNEVKDTKRFKMLARAGHDAKYLPKDLGQTAVSFVRTFTRIPAAVAAIGATVVAGTTGFLAGFANAVTKRAVTDDTGRLNHRREVQGVRFSVSGPLKGLFKGIFKEGPKAAYHTVGAMAEGVKAKASAQTSPLKKPFSGIKGAVTGPVEQLVKKQPGYKRGAVPPVLAEDATDEAKTQYRHEQKAYRRAGLKENAHSNLLGIKAVFSDTAQTQWRTYVDQRNANAPAQGQGPEVV